MKLVHPFYFILIIIFIIGSPTSQLSASAVPLLLKKTAVSTAAPVDKKIKKQQKKRLQKRLKKAKKKHPEKITHEAHLPWLWTIIAWYVLFLTLLIIGLVLQIAIIWVSAIVFLAAPPALALIIFLIMLFSLAFGNTNL